MPERTRRSGAVSGYDLLEAGAEFGAVDVLVVLYEFEISVTGQVMAFEKDETLAFEGEGVLVELIEIKDAVGDLNGEFGVFHDIVMTEIAKASIDDGIGDVGFDIVEPIVFRLQEKGASSD